MIPTMNIIAWGNVVPWAEQRQVEQDLIISRAIVDLFSDRFLRERLRFRGGTALNKLHFPSPIRYSEDIDLVRTSTGPMKPTIDHIRERLEPWLGPASFDRSAIAPKLKFRVTAEDPASTAPIRLKLEINTSETMAFDAPQEIVFRVDNPWFAGETSVPTFSRAEILATKLRAPLDEALDHGDIEGTVLLAMATADPADLLFIDAEEHCELCDPLIEQWLAVHKNQPLGPAQEALPAFLHAALRYPLAARILVGAPATAPKTRSEAEDHNLGVALRRNLQAYLKKQRPAARAFFLNVIRDPRVSHLLDESLATAKRWQTERHPTDRTDFDRLHLLHSREFARSEAHKLGDLVVADQREAKATVQ